AQRLVGEGREAEADTRLGQALARCAPGPDGGACRTQLGLASATVAEVRAAAEPNEQARWLQVAVSRYEAVLAESPADAPTLGRLARLHVQRGDRARAETLLESALRTFPDQEAIALLVGDFHRDAKNLPAAIRAYRFAMERHPTSDPARRRLVQAYVTLLPA